MSPYRKRVKSVNVDFGSSEISKVQRYGSSVPQLFDQNMQPILAVNQYMRIQALRLAGKSLNTTKEHLIEFMEWLLSSDLGLGSIDEDGFGNYIEALCCYKKSNGERLSWNTVNSRIAGAYRFLAWASVKGHCPELNVYDTNITSSGARYRYRSLSHPSSPMSEPVKFLSMDNALKFIDALGMVSGKNNKEVKKRNVLMGAFMLETGVRITEACKFPVHDLPEVNTRLKQTPARLAHGKGSKARVILIPNNLLMKLWEYVDIDRENVMDRAVCKSRKSISRSLFVSCNGNDISPNWMQKLFRKASEYTNLNASPHVLRHTFGTYHYLLNQDIEGLATLMGHEESATTKKYYVGMATTISFAKTYSGLQESIDQQIEGALNE